MAEDIGEITFYRGKNIDEMTREELVEALKYMGALYSEALVRNVQNLRTMSEFRHAADKRRCA